MFTWPITAFFNRHYSANQHDSVTPRGLSATWQCFVLFPKAGDTVQIRMKPTVIVTTSPALSFLSVEINIFGKTFIFKHHPPKTNDGHILRKVKVQYFSVYMNYKSYKGTCNILEAKKKVFYFIIQTICWHLQTLYTEYYGARFVNWNIQKLTAAFCHI